MIENLDVIRLANALAEHAAGRQTHIATNVANADTPGYQAQDLKPFDPNPVTRELVGMRATRERHLSGVARGLSQAAPQIVDGERAPNGNSVSLEREMVRAVEARRQHDLALAIYGSALGIMRSSIGRGR